MDPSLFTIWTKLIAFNQSKDSKVLMTSSIFMKPCSFRLLRPGKDLR